ncbi:MAG TPA: sigma-54 dependent transcriptional regulator [Geobacteraceae bacterium]|nr:sigma-54 dependent transcriptional regulator [Geobacteraceae bacterium]
MKEKILIIDDDPSLRRVLEYNFQEEGYEVIVAESGGEGLRIFADHNPPLVMTDLKMPGIDGFHVLREIKMRSPDTLVLIITAYGAVDTAVEAMKLGAYDYITKPFNRDELKLVVRKALQVSNLSQENRRLKERLSEKVNFKNIVGMSQAMKKVFTVVQKVANTDATVLITGESGTGKELVAKAIHALSSRNSAPFVPINCAAIPRDLLESELFGHVKGAFTGAIKDKTGKFIQSDGGTLFLDEVGDLPLDLQPKLLRALQERVVEPVGSTESLSLDARVIAATNADLEQAIREGTFREDLFYRLSVIPIRIPPLRERKDDIPLLLKHFAARHGFEAIAFDRDALDSLSMYHWPGNVRELENTVERLIIMHDGETISREDLPEKILLGEKELTSKVVNIPDDGYSLEQLEREVIVEALERNQWNQTNAAVFLKIPRHILLYRIEKYGIVTPGKKR